MAAYPKIGLIAFLNTADFVRGMAVYTSGLAKISAETLATSGGLGKQWVGLGDGVVRAMGITTVAIAAMGLATAGVFAKFSFDAVKASMDFESAFAGVVKTAGNLTISYGVLNEEGEKLKQQLIDMSMVKPMPFEGLAEIMMIGAQAGLPSGVLLPYTDMIADLVTATEMLPEQAATRIAQFMTVMGLVDADALKTKENIESLGATIANLGNKFPGTEEEIVVLAGRLAGMGKAVGMAATDILALAAAMIAVGVRSEAGGTAGQRVMIGMQEAFAAAASAGTGIVDNNAKIAESDAKILELEEHIALKRLQIAEQTDRTSAYTRASREESLADLEAKLAEEQSIRDAYADSNGKTYQTMNKQAKAYADLMGVTVAEATNLWRDDPGEAMRLFILGLSKTKGETAAILKELGLGDARLIRTFSQLAGAGDLINEAMYESNVAWEEQTALVKEAMERYATLDSIFAMLKNRWKAFQVPIGDTFRPAIRHIIETFKLLDAPGKKIVTWFQKKFGPALEDAAIAWRLFTEGDKTGAASAWRAALIMLFGAETTLLIESWADKIETAYLKVRDFIIKYSDEIKGAFKGLAVVLAAAGITSIILRIAGALGFILTPLGLLMTTAALLGIAWETNWNGFRDKVLEVIAVLGPAISTFWTNLQTWFNTDLAPRIESGDWVAVGITIWNKVREGIDSAIAAGLELDEIVRGWFTAGLEIPIDVHEMDKGPQIASWEQIGATIMESIMAGFGKAKITTGNLLDQLANAIGKQLGITPILNSDMIQKNVEGQVGWGQIGMKLAQMLLEHIELRAEWLKDFGTSFTAWASEGGAGYDLSFGIGKLLGKAITAGIAWVWSNKEELAAIGLAIGKGLEGLAEGLLTIGYNIGKGIIFAIVGAMTGFPESQIQAAYDDIFKNKGKTIISHANERLFGATSEEVEASAAGYQNLFGGPNESVWSLISGFLAETKVKRDAYYAQLETDRRAGILAHGELEAHPPRRGDSEYLGANPFFLPQMQGWEEGVATLATSYEREKANELLWVANFNQTLAGLSLETDGAVLSLSASNIALFNSAVALGATSIEIDKLLLWIQKRYERQLSEQPASESNYGPPRGFAGGTNFFGGGLARVGERGPETVWLPRGTRIYANDSLMGRMSMPASTVNNSYVINQTLPVGSPYETRQAAKIGVLEGLSQFGIKTAG